MQHKETLLHLCYDAQQDKASLEAINHLSVRHSGHFLVQSVMAAVTTHAKHFFCLFQTNQK